MEAFRRRRGAKTVFIRVQLDQRGRIGEYGQNRPSLTRRASI
jgi:hypothetical protein